MGPQSDDEVSGRVDVIDIHSRHMALTMMLATERLVVFLFQARDPVRRTSACAALRLASAHAHAPDRR